jgi:N-acetylneuraminic acid mutarotase
MKNGTTSCGLVAVAIALFAFSGCGGGNSTASTSSSSSSGSGSGSSGGTPAIHNQWTWVAGSNTTLQTGTYGTLGTPAAANIPPARYGASSWTDASGNFWMFGGISSANTNPSGYYNDLWKYSAGQWTWVGGSNAINQPGVYGTLGTAAAANIPAPRTLAGSWKDSSGNFWLFGGVSLDKNSVSVYLNDLWKYSGGQWTWVAGAIAGTPVQAAVYGVKGTAAATNYPGARLNPATWADASGNFWMFGGNGADSTATVGNLNDLWKYSGGQWTWVSGSNLANQPGTYGTLGTAAAANTPSGRYNTMSWTDASGNLWLFGGNLGVGSAFTPLNDLWKFSGGQWTWMSGSSTTGQSGSYGTLGTAGATNTPGARLAGATWTDSSGALWLFGGSGIDSAGAANHLNDLWKYSGGQWTWVNGPNVGGGLGVYGTQGTGASTNIPGGRTQSVSWLDSSGNLWLFGGLGYSASGPANSLNDLWEYQP